LTTTVTVVVPVQPTPLVPVTVYVIVLAGLAVTVPPVVEDRFVAGLHIKLLAPVAVSVVLLPAQIVAPAAVITGVEFTDTVTADELLQPEADVPVTV
jgi:hypothetical protein